MNDMLINEGVVVPIVWRNGVSTVSNKLHGMDITTWDSNLWRLSHWYREA
jgi:hypothetical protein